MTHSLGLGCWPLSGPMFLDGKSVGYTTCDPKDAAAILDAAYDHGIRLFDTAQAYGCGYGERLLGDTLANRDIQIVTKIGLAIDEDTKTITGPRLDPAQVAPSVDESRARLRRDVIDVVLLHPNDVPIDSAQAIFAELDALADQGKIGAFGWSTDYPDRAQAQTSFPRATHVEHVMNVFFDAATLRDATRNAALTHLIRSPLAMGLLAGRFDDGATLDPDDVRVASHAGMDWFEGTGAHPRFAARLAAIRELLQSDGRSLAQGALAWLWAHGPSIVPVPGASKLSQVIDNAEARAKGPLPAETVAEIAALIPTEVWPDKSL
ncbi:MAG: aldo/keto reductase [Pseudomonadota bacterium]